MQAVEPSPTPIKSKPVAKLFASTKANNKTKRGKAPKVRTAKLNKTEFVLKLLRRETGASIDEMVKATGWQAHSVRGFLSGTVKKKLGLDLLSKTDGDGTRRYRINDGKPV